MNDTVFLNDDGELTTVMQPFFKTPFNHNTWAEAQKTALVCLDESKTQQHFKEESDINTIVDRFLKSGTLPQIPLPPLLDDFSDVFDFQSAMNVMAAAKESFMALPAHVRDSFQNNPHYFVSQLDAMIHDQDKDRRENNMKVLRAMNLAVEPGPKADTTTLGDVLAAIKANAPSGEAPAPEGAQTAL